MGREIFNLPFELWYFHPQVAQFNEKEFAKFFRSLGNVANTAPATVEEMINQRNVLWQREKRFEVPSTASYLRCQSMAAKYEFMKVIPGPSHGIHSQNVSERNRIGEREKRRMKWNFIDIGHGRACGGRGGRRKDRNLSGAELLRELQNRNYDNTGHCPIHTNLLRPSSVRCLLSSEPHSRDDFSYQTLWWWQKSIENIFSAT